VVRGNKRVEARSIFLPFHIPLMICPESCSGIGLISRYFSRYSAAGSKWCLVNSWSYLSLWNCNNTICD